uniref:Uncharacterized protein n=1 Tax=Arundo donax TaxID=35708 RepID=A0A0A9GSQ1_ARUDO
MRRRRPRRLSRRQWLRASGRGPWSPSPARSPCKRRHHWIRRSRQNHSHCCHYEESTCRFEKNQFGWVAMACI